MALQGRTEVQEIRKDAAERERGLAHRDRQWRYYGVILGIKICQILVLWSRRDKRLLRENIEAESKNSDS